MQQGLPVNRDPRRWLIAAPLLVKAAPQRLVASDE